MVLDSKLSVFLGTECGGDGGRGVGASDSGSGSDTTTTTSFSGAGAGAAETGGGGATGATKASLFFLISTLIESSFFNSSSFDCF